MAAKSGPQNSEAIVTEFMITVTGDDGLSSGENVTILFQQRLNTVQVSDMFSYRRNPCSLSQNHN